MAFPYDTAFTNNNKVDLDTFPAVPAVNKVLASEYNALTSGANALATAITAGQYFGLADNALAPLSAAGGVMLRNSGGVLGVSGNGDQYQDIDLSFASPGLVLGCTNINVWSKINPKIAGSGNNYFVGTEQIFLDQSLCTLLPSTATSAHTTVTADPAIVVQALVGDTLGPWVILNVGDTYNIIYNTGTYLQLRGGTVTLKPGDSLTVYAVGAGVDPGQYAMIKELSRSIA